MLVFLYDRARWFEDVEGIQDRDVLWRRAVDTCVVVRIFSEVGLVEHKSAVVCEYGLGLTIGEDLHHPLL